MNNVLHLVADIGGTTARFAINISSQAGTIDLHHQQFLHHDACASVHELITQYLESIEHLLTRKVQHGMLAVASPVTGDRVEMTNRQWSFSISALRAQLGMKTLEVINDFAALAYSLNHLAPNERRVIGDIESVSKDYEQTATIGVVGAGTGLGVSSLVTINNNASRTNASHYRAFESEGGHATYPAIDEREHIVVAYAGARYGHVSAERLLSGAGLALIYVALNPHRQALSAAAISAAAASGDSECLETLHCFFGMLGTFAGNAALTLNCRGGIYIGGGIAQKNVDALCASPFRARFEQKGRLSSWLQNVPTWVITASAPALRGAALMLSCQRSAKSC
jgi:glucokinase